MKGAPDKGMGVGRILQVWEAAQSLVLRGLGEKQKETDQEGRVGCSEEFTVCCDDNQRLREVCKQKNVA